MLTDVTQAAILRVIQALWDVKGTRNRSLAEPFAELPDKAAWKDYYRVIPHPRCLDVVKENVESGNYQTAAAAYDDLNLVFANALHFNEDGSSISNDARTLRATLESAWSSEVHLEQPATIAKASTPPPLHHSASTPGNMDDNDVSPAGGQQETNWESMKPRDKQGDEIVRRTEALLPRWKGPGPDGWMVLHDHDAKDPYSRYVEILRRLNSHKDIGAETLSSEALNRIAESASLPELSFTTPMSLSLIESRVSLRAYPSPKEFDMDVCRLFEKGRKWFEEGSRDYGRVLVLQRLYQGLSSSIPALKVLTKTAPNNFAFVAAGPGFAKPLHSAGSTSEDAVTTYRIQNKERTFLDEVAFKGMVYKSGDYVHLMNPNDPSRPIIGQIFKVYKPDNAAPRERYVTACWYFRPEQTFHSPQRPFWEHEVFKTGHFADHALEDIIEKVGCQFMTRHIRGRPKPPMWYPTWPLYVCDSRYNDRDRVFVRIKNWNSCIPDELRKADFMPIQAYDRTVMPRKVDSPFLRGVQGPGGLVEEDEWRRKSKRAAAATAAKSGTSGTVMANEGELNREGGASDPSPGPLALATDSKAPLDRSLMVAAGGRAVLGSEPIVETLPEETTRYFDRDPHTNELLWFSGPPIAAVNPQAHVPRHSLKYLDFLAKKKALAEKERAQAEEEMELEDDDEEAEGEPNRKRMRSEGGHDEASGAPMTLREALNREFAFSSGV